MTAAVYDITIEQGSVFVLEIVYKDANGDPIDLTGYSAKMQVRDGYSGPVCLDLSTANGKITLGTTDGSVHAEATAIETAAIRMRQGVYDLELIPPQGVEQTRRLIQGVAYVNPEATKP